jgi:hypothetical protein
MLEGVKLSDCAENKSFFGSDASSDYDNIFKMAEEMYRDLRLIKRMPIPRASVDRRYVTALAGKVAYSSTETPIEYKAPPRGATPSPRKGDRSISNPTRPRWTRLARRSG